MGAVRSLPPNTHIPMDNNLGQDYVFPGCTAYLAECLGRSDACDYWSFANMALGPVGRTRTDTEVEHRTDLAVH